MKETTKLICVAIVTYCLGGIVQAYYYHRQDEEKLRYEYLKGVADGVEEILTKKEESL